MGLDFSFPLSLSRPTPPSPPPSSKRRRRPHGKAKTPHLSSACLYAVDSRTQRNTLLNRSNTSVSRHVALMRLAQRLAALKHTKREQVIRQLGLGGGVLKEVRKYMRGWFFGDAKRGAAGAGGVKRSAAKVRFAEFAEIRLFRE
eukprot:GFKZ01015448.1.p1 GENE.GFKZ01015448.1~~GFKZ01015448.1.p1  ORF type:complete len:144 (+),score=18.85 GFKZ01015448.1:211-642(+)